MTVKTLDFNAYKANALKDPQWKSYLQRWEYHAWAIALVNGMSLLFSAKSVLEIGAFGAGIVIGSDRMDLPDGKWVPPDDLPTIWHDARIIPWPFKDRQYSLLIALRLWHHLAPVQRECFLEAKRIARNILIVCPEKEVVGVGITRSQFIQWNGGESPVVEYYMGAWGYLYLWKGDAP
jgi:hypothetical protein